jgi:hypothetical protein
VGIGGQAGKSRYLTAGWWYVCLKYPRNDQHFNSDSGGLTINESGLHISSHTVTDLAYGVESTRPSEILGWGCCSRLIGEITVSFEANGYMMVRALYI